jgi:hypothetical protein
VVEFYEDAFALAWNAALVAIALAALIMTGLGNPDFNCVPRRVPLAKKGK